MRLNKEKAKGIAMGIITLFPLYGTAKYFYDSFKLMQYYRNGGVSYSDIESLINSMPTTQAQYEHFVETGDKHLIKLYDDALSQTKLVGDVSPKFLEEHGYASQDDFWDNMDSLYALGKAGDEAAKEEFNSTMSAYQDDFFGQAYDLASQGYFDAMQALPVGTFDASILDCLSPANAESCITLIVSVGLLVICTYLNLKFLKERKQNKKVPTMAKSNGAKNTVKLNSDKRMRKSNEIVKRANELQEISGKYNANKKDGLTIEEAKEKYKDEHILL